MWVECETGIKGKGKKDEKSLSTSHDKTDILITSHKEEKETKGVTKKKQEKKTKEKKS